LPDVVKFSELVYYGSPKATKWLKSTYDQIKHGKRRPNWKWLNTGNAAADCPFLLKFARLVHYGSLGLNG